MMSSLDDAHRAMLDGGEADAMRFYETLADTTLFVVLEAEARDHRFLPRLWPLESGPVVLAFDLEERLARLSDEPLPYVALPGRVIAAQLAGQGIGLGVNLGGGDGCEVLLPPEAMEWLAGMLALSAERIDAQLQGFGPPTDDALCALAERGLARVRASEALLSATRWQDGSEGHLLVVVGLPEQDEPAAVRAVAEALLFGGRDAGDIEIAFRPSGDNVAGNLRAVARELAVAAPPTEADDPATAPSAPGMDPANPPRLR